MKHGRDEGKKKIGNPRNRSAGVSFRSRENAGGRQSAEAGEMGRGNPGDGEKKEGNLNEVIGGEGRSYLCDYGAYFLWLFRGAGRGLEAIQENGRC
jgi:hypothetical protein